MSQPANPSQQRLAAILRGLREQSGMSTYELAAALEWSQPRVSRMERGRIAATADDVEAWADATQATAPVRDELTQLAYDAWTEARSWRMSHRHGLAGRQRSMGATERQATLVRHFQPEAVPGLLQSPAYARRVIEMADVTGQRDIDEAVAARLERQQILREPGRDFRWVLTEGALRWRPGAAEIMTEQRGHLLAAAALEAVNLAVIPYEREALEAYIHPFTIYDLPGAPMVLTEQYSRETEISDPGEVAVYARVFGTLGESALHGAEALEFIRSVML
jgi:transcriptional regulator with XRE-family HTH domain